jgi:hypothetical protein
VTGPEVTTVYLCLEAAGCPTVCRHCWAQGTRYGAMPLADIAWVLEQAHRFCDDRGLGFESYPMHEMAAHPDAARLFQLFHDHSASARSGSLFEPLTTTGVPLAMREDWRDVLQAAADTGTANVWVAFHGFADEHDRQVGRRGAFAETCLGVERSLAAGLAVGGNIFVNTANLHQLAELAATLRRLPIAPPDLWWGIVSFLPTARSRHLERIRPRLPDLLPVAGRIAELTCERQRGFWADLEDHTEAAFVRRAISGTWPDPAPFNGELALVCRPNLDVYAGLAGLYRTLHGNLRTDGVEAVLDRALAEGYRPDDELWFGPEARTAQAELAARYGDPAGLGVHPGATSARYLWLDRAQRARSA